VQAKLENKILAKLESEVAELNAKVNNLSDTIASKANHMAKTTDVIISSQLNNENDSSL